MYLSVFCTTSYGLTHPDTTCTACNLEDCFGFKNRKADTVHEDKSTVQEKY